MSGRMATTGGWHRRVMTLTNRVIVATALILAAATGPAVAAVNCKAARAQAASSIRMVTRTGQMFEAMRSAASNEDLRGLIVACRAGKRDAPTWARYGRTTGIFEAADFGDELEFLSLTCATTADVGTMMGSMTRLTTLADAMRVKINSCRPR